VFVALGIQYAMRMRRIILSSVACPALQYFFPHYLTKGKISGKKNVIKPKMCFYFYLQTSFETIRWGKFQSKTQL